MPFEDVIEGYFLTRRAILALRWHRCPPDRAAASGRRDAAVTAMYELTCQRAALEPPTEQMRRLVAALHGNQVDTDQFIAVTAQHWRPKVRRAR